MELQEICEKYYCPRCDRIYPLEDKYTTCMGCEKKTQARKFEDNGKAGLILLHPYKKGLEKKAQS